MVSLCEAKEGRGGAFKAAVGMEYKDSGIYFIDNDKWHFVIITGIDDPIGEFSGLPR